ncbi:MAG: putative YigZ family protein [Planctomycetota bacterium]|jgi:uncharacterized YigZ family protein
MPAGVTRHEIDKIKGSRFIATLAPISDSGQAEVILRQIRADFSDARHTCYAWRIDAAGRETRSHDDGEPAGSAGKPILQQIAGRGLAHTIVAVTRYFGGTKLGVGGLMRAYGAAAAAALELGTYSEVLRTDQVGIKHPYECSSAVQALLAAWKLVPESSDYTDIVRLQVLVPHSLSQNFLDELREATADRATTSMHEGQA